MDNCLLRAVRYMHSSSNEVRSNLWTLLEEAIKNKYGTAKELGSPTNFPALIQEISNATTTEAVLLKDDNKTASSSDNELELDLLKEDLMCVVCKGMGVGARNRLVECTDCHNLYHQECHDPTISEDEMESSQSWSCASCKGNAVNKSTTATAHHTSSTHQNSSSVITQSKFYAKDSKTSSSKSKSSTSSDSTVPHRTLTPNINIVSADKRIQIMKKKAAKLQEKRKLSR